MSDLEYELIYYFPKDKKGLKKIPKDNKKSNPFNGNKNNIYNKIVKNF